MTIEVLYLWLKCIIFSLTTITFVVNLYYIYLMVGITFYYIVGIIFMVGITIMGDSVCSLFE